MRARTIAIALFCITMFATTPVATSQTNDDTVTADITLRVAPEGFVVPSLHWTTTWLTGESTEAVWIIDPVEDQRFNSEDGVAGCASLTVTEGDGQIDGGDVLDAATEDGCISGWDYSVHDKYGRSVDMVDGLWQSNNVTGGYPAGHWMIQVDGHHADVGIDSMDLQNGQSLSFVYWLHA